MSNFNPTHEFRGLELEFEDRNTHEVSYYTDAEGRDYVLPDEMVTKLLPLARPGEVYVARFSYEAGPGIRIIDDQGRARDLNGTVVARAGTVAGFIEDGDYKLLVKADGTKA